MKMLAVLAVTLPLLVAQTERAQPRIVTAVRHWTTGDVTRVAVEVSGEFQFHSDRLHNPERIYFDIVNSRPHIDKKVFFSETIEDKLLQRIRVAETTPGVSRIVLDLGASVEVNTSQLTNPSRLMIELRAMSVTAQSPAESAAPVPTPAIAPVKPPVIPPPSAAPPPAKVPAAIKAADISGDSVTAEPSKSDLATPAAVSAAAAAPPAVPMAVPMPAASKSVSSPALQAETGKAARHTSSGDTSLVRALGLKINRVVIDPGHGGHDVGTQGPHGLLEKELVLDVALRLGKMIEDRMGAEVIYTRSDDTFIPLEGRTALANEKKADLFLSIHANSSPVPRITGVETYYLNFPSSKDAADVASRENATSDKSIFELRDLVQKITLHDKSEESKDFAGRLQTALFAFSARNFPAEKNRGIKKAPFVVLIGANMPSVLAEIGFLTNVREESLLKKPDYRQKLADALFRGISKYAESLSHFQVAQTGAPPQ
ncbi:MAG TPA: N-acetylmuramoyl-L-alanine amidase [Candidatus Sulfopaludibacter sp.]|jgi:N-acetylmuramoyl-L-alanine amidase|nr:N-acetylmuramoyl-L-alanine amidase [Candidatus Sulfopaludibacter sp.]